MSVSIRLSGLPVLALITLTTSFVFAQDTSSPSGHGKTSAGIAAADSTFMKKAADGGLAEVELGKLAAEKGSSQEVKDFGQRMVDDHSKANDQLKQLASQKHVELPQQPSSKHEATKAKLEKLSGEDFDKAYVAEMLKDHKQDVAEFKRESKSAHDDDLRSFASQTLPTLQEHLKQVQNLASAHHAEASSTRPPSASQR
jgi:putative membrane protein